MIRNRNINLLIVLFAVLILSSFKAVSGEEIETGSPKISTKELWKNTKEVKLEHVLTIGTDDFEENENYFFALIIDIDFDKYGNLFVLDSKNWKINKYSPQGAFLQSFTLNKGKGPGDYTWLSKIAIDKDGKIYIADRYKRVTVLDNNGKVLKVFSFKETGMLADIAVGLDNSIYLTKFHNTNIDRIFQFSPLDGGIIKTFCKSVNDGIFRDNEFGAIALDPAGNIHYTTGYPYSIKKFSKNGKLLNHFSREANFQKPLANSKFTSGIEFASISMGIAIFPDGKILNLIRHPADERINKDKQKYWFDVFSKEGEWLKSFSNELLKNEMVRFFNIDPFGYLYLDYFYPYPHIKKYKIEFVDKK